MSAKPTDLFRQDAVEHYTTGTLDGDLLRLTPRWISFTYPVLILSGLLGLLFLALAHVQEYASGPAIVVVDPRTSETRLRIVGLIPSRYRPQLTTGMKARVSLPGYGHAYQDVELTVVADRAIGPEQASRYLGQDISDALTGPGPVVLVEGYLPHHTFHTSGVTYNYHHGMRAVMDLQIRSEPAILALIPGFKVLTKASHD